MKYIAEADARTKEKEARIAKEDKIKKEAVNKSQAEDRKNKKKSKWLPAWLPTWNVTAPLPTWI